MASAVNPVSLSREPAASGRLGSPKSPVELVRRARKVVPLSQFAPNRIQEAAEISEVDWRGLAVGAFRDLAPLPRTEHGTEVDGECAEKGTLIRFTPEELREREVLVGEDGRLYLGSLDIPFDTQGKIYIFVMHTDGKIYATEPIDQVVFHSSLMPEGELPIAAGMIRVIDGVPRMINERSGHFAPFQRLAYVVSELYHQGCKAIAEAEIIPNKYKRVEIEERPVDRRKERLEEIRSAKSGGRSGSEDGEPRSAGPESRRMLTPQLARRSLHPPKAAASPLARNRRVQDLQSEFPRE